MGERIGVFGGTFDPIHVAHVVAAVEARYRLDLDRVLLAVAGDPWQKRGHVVASAVDRLAMVEAAVEGIDGLEACDLEVSRAGSTYTVDTLEALAAPDRDLFLIVGEDVAAGLGSWRGHDRLPALATLVVVARAGVTSAGDPPAGWRVEHVAIPRLEISSTDLRSRAEQGMPLEGLVPAGAVRVIRERGLYR